MARDISIDLTRDTVSASTEVEAPAADVFAYVCRPENHPAISGDDSVRGLRVGPDVLDEGARFGMSMKMFGLPYRVTSKVVEYEPDRLIAWCHIAGHRWRWSIEPLDDGRCRVTETFDLSTAKAPPFLRLMGYPKGHRDNVSHSVDAVASHFDDE